MARVINRRETHEAIVDAAERLLDRYGYSKMTMTDLADEAGIGVGTTYLYFPGKIDVALAVLERLSEQVRIQLQEIAASDRSATIKMREMLINRIMLRYQVARARHHQIDEFKQAVQGLLTERRARWLGAETQVFAGVLLDGREQGMFEFDDPSSTAEALMQATICFTPRYLTRQDFEQPELFQRNVMNLVDLLLRALRPINRV